LLHLIENITGIPPPTERDKAIELLRPTFAPDLLDQCRKSSVVLLALSLEMPGAYAVGYTAIIAGAFVVKGDPRHGGIIRAPFTDLQVLFLGHFLSNGLKKGIYEG
jgi:hypothetical protein